MRQPAIVGSIDIFLRGAFYFPVRYALGESGRSPCSEHIGGGDSGSFFRIISRTVVAGQDRAMKRLRTLVGIGLGLAVVAGAGWYIAHLPSAPAARPGGRFAANAAVPVGIATAVKGDIPIVLKGLGTVTPLAMVTVKTQVGGQLIRVNFEEGQMVKEGDLLAEVDPRPYEVALQQALGTLQKDQALLKNAQIDLQRYKTLVAQQSIATQQYDTQAAVVSQYEAAITTDQGLVDGAKLNLTYTRITAPVTGRVGLRQVDRGNYVQVNDVNGLVILTQIQPISVLFTIPEDSLPAVRKRMAAARRSRSRRWTARRKSSWVSA